MFLDFSIHILELDALRTPEESLFQMFSIAAAHAKRALVAAILHRPVYAPFVTNTQF